MYEPFHIKFTISYIAPIFVSDNSECGMAFIYFVPYVSVAFHCNIYQKFCSFLT